MMTLQGNSQCFDRIGNFGVLMEIPGMWINRLYVSVWFSKTLKVCVIAAMAPVSRFELIGDEYLHATPECCEIILRLGWLGFLQRFSGFNVVFSKVFTESFDGVNAQVGDIELKLNKEFISQAIGLPQTGEWWYKGKHVKNDD